MHLVITGLGTGPGPSQSIQGRRAIKSPARRRGAPAETGLAAAGCAKCSRSSRQTWRRQGATRTETTLDKRSKSLQQAFQLPRCDYFSSPWAGGDPQLRRLRATTALCINIWRTTATPTATLPCAAFGSLRKRARTKTDEPPLKSL